MSMGVEIVLERNAFYRDNYQQLLLALFLMIAINMALLIIIIYKWSHPLQPQYFATTASGRIIKIYPLNDPVVSNDYVLQWAVEAVRKAFNLDYLHWREQLQNSETYFTPSGWRYFISALKASNNLTSLVDLKMVANAEITGAPQIVRTAIVDKRYAWKIEVPVLIVYTDGKTKNIRIPMNITLIVFRVPVAQNPQRIAINNFFSDNINPDALQKAIQGL